MLVSFLSHTFAATASLPPILLNMYLWNSRARSLALYCLLLYQLLLLMFAAACFPLPSLLHQEHESREKKTCDLRLSSLSLFLYLYTHNHAPVVVLVKLSGWRSSAGWTASPGPRTDRRRWLRTLPECTSCGSAASAGPACR